MSSAATKLTPREIKQRFADVHPAMSPDEALTEASRCLYCFDAPCARACPTHIDVPGFIRKILHRNPVGAAKTILDANIFGGSCARVCPTEVLCEGACVDNTMLQSPVQIGRLQRFACDAADPVSLSFYASGPDTGRRVAVVGGGPAGLTCAHELRKRGHSVVVFEARKVLGGLNTLGIAAYKISTEFALSEVERAVAMGVDVRLKQKVDGSRVRELLAEFDAVILAVGLSSTAPLNIPGENLTGVWESLAFIFQTHTKPLPKCTVGRHVVVIGGGNTAIDAANAAKKLGAETVTIAYRRDRASMPAFEHERVFAENNGIAFEFNAKPLRIIGKNKRVSGVRFARTRMQGKGRAAKLVRVPGKDFTIRCDMVIKALGQEVHADLLKSVPKLKLDRRGRVLIDPETQATSVPGLFAAGDCQSGAGEEVVNAVQAGKIVSAGVDAYLSGARREASRG